ncbi:Nuclear transcription factor Y subunit B-6 [Heracleum sosnowskyi]|uniref:Nuclear transcription factor Y subunit B-6 n=1 Tax=Heracleum sosnowskyi TaxID=360622 RepID=A0AAD8IBM2_9APIA|nr:Nuclear transcription factor Y subunit B-6 [Heracleum sosnowskyi]
MERADQQGRGFQEYQRIPQQQQQIPDSGPISSEIDNNQAAGDKDCIVREQDRFMPIANVIRLMRKSIPSHAKISDDAKELVQESVSEFISFVTSEANFRCQKEKRKTITAEDVLWAMSNLGFDDYIEPLTFYLDRFREADGGERGALRGEPLMRRSVELGAIGIPPTFAPGYYMGPHNALLGAMTMGGFVNDVHNAGPSGAGVNSLDP